MPSSSSICAARNALLECRRRNVRDLLRTGRRAGALLGGVSENLFLLNGCDAFKAFSPSDKRLRDRNGYRADMIRDSLTDRSLEASVKKNASRSGSAAEDFSLPRRNGDIFHICRVEYFSHQWYNFHLLIRRVWSGL